jgi:hypothetical protein
MARTSDGSPGDAAAAMPYDFAKDGGTSKKTRTPAALPPTPGPGV